MWMIFSNICAQGKGGEQFGDSCGLQAAGGRPEDISDGGDDGGSRVHTGLSGGRGWRGKGGIPTESG